MPDNRKLAISCKFVGHYDPNGPNGAGLYGDMTYTQLVEGTDPPMPVIVLGGGEIDVFEMPSDPRYANSMDIFLSLDPSSYCTLQDGTRATVAWPPMIMNMPNTQSACVVRVSRNGPPVSPEDAAVRWADGQVGRVIQICDRDESKNYYYCPAVFVNVPNANPYYIECDPTIRNRGT